MNSIFSGKGVVNWFLESISSTLGSSVSKGANELFHGLINGKGSPQGQIDTFKHEEVTIAPKEMDLMKRLEVPLFPNKQDSNRPSPQTALTIQPSLPATNLPTELPSEPMLENRALPAQEISAITDEEPEEFDPIPEESPIPPSAEKLMQDPQKSAPKLTSPDLSKKPLATPETVARNMGKSFVKLAIAGTTGAYYLAKRSFVAGCQGVFEQGAAEMQKGYQAAAAKFPSVDQGIKKAGSVLKIQELAQKAVQTNPFKPTELFGAALIAYGLYRWCNKKQQQTSSSNPGSGVIVNVNVQAAPTNACLHALTQNPPSQTSTNSTGGCQCQHKSP